VTRRRRWQAELAPRGRGRPHPQRSPAYVGLRDAPSARERSICDAPRGAPSGTDRRIAGGLSEALTCEAAAAVYIRRLYDPPSVSEWNTGRSSARELGIDPCRTARGCRSTRLSTVDGLSMNLSLNGRSGPPIYASMTGAAAGDHGDPRPPGERRPTANRSVTGSSPVGGATYRPVDTGLRHSMRSPKLINVHGAACRAAGNPRVDREGTSAGASYQVLV